jgi:HD-like signal output (HDOD) protein
MNSETYSSPVDIDGAKGNLTSDERLELLLSTAKNIPSAPSIAIRVCNEVDNPQSSARTVANALAADPLLTAKVLRMANSVFYGASRRISTVTDSIVLLGMQTIRTLAMAASCQPVLDTTLGRYGLQQGELWQRAFCVGIASQVIATKLRYPIPEEAFVVGLLHDLGKVVIDSNTCDEFDQIITKAYSGNNTFDQAERLILGFDHARVGAALLQNWRLPDALVFAVENHHQPSKELDSNPLTAFVHIADFICLNLGIGIGTDGLRYDFDTNVLDSLKIKDKMLDTIAVKVMDCLADPDMIY